MRRLQNEQENETTVPVEISTAGMFENIVIETLGFKTIKNSEAEEEQERGFQLPLG